ISRRASAIAPMRRALRSSPIMSIPLQKVRKCHGSTLRSWIHATPVQLLPSPPPAPQRAVGRTLALESARRNERQQQEWWPLAVEMQGRRATEEVRRTVDGLLVQEWSDTGLRIRNARRIDRRTVEAIVTSTHRQTYLIAGGYGDARRPDLHIQLDGLAGRQWPQLVVRVIRLVRQAASGVELAV